MINASSSARRLDLSVIISTYQRPLHLQRCLLTLAAQRNVSGKFEAIVVDDGSQDDTASMVESLVAEVNFPLRFVTHPHDGFQLSRCRNRGIRIAAAPYLLLVDGDCLFPPDHLARQLEARRPGVVRAGHSIRLDEHVTAAIDADAVRAGDWLQKISRWARVEQYRHWLRSELEYRLRHPSRPKLVGNSIGIWREQLERINGFDQEFRGWGCEDDDLRRRLVQSGQRIRTFSWYGVSYHMWHPPDSTAPTQWRLGNNVNYFRRPVVLTSCLDGLQRRSIEQVCVQVTADKPGCDDDPHGRLAERLRELLGRRTGSPELELLFYPQARRFRSGTAPKIAIVSPGQRLPFTIQRNADAVLHVPHNADERSLMNEIYRLASILQPKTLSEAA